MKIKNVTLLLAFLLLLAVPSKAQIPAGYNQIGTTSGAVTFTDTACPDGTTCYYVVTAVDGFGFESGPTNVASGLIPNSGTHSVSLSWTASATTGVTYRIYAHVGPLAPTNLTKTVS